MSDSLGLAAQLREIDALVEVEIFGMRWLTCTERAGIFGRGSTYLFDRDKATTLLREHADKFATESEAPGDRIKDDHGARHFTTDPVECAALKRKLREGGYGCFIEIHPDLEPVDVSVIGSGGQESIATAATEERALALAALRAYGVEVEYEPGQAS